MKIIALTVVALAIASASAVHPASAKEFGRSEKTGDMNMFQLEPSILNERFFTSGKADRQQFCGKVLPAGAPIPDSDAPLSEQANPAPNPAPKEVKETPSSTNSRDAAPKPASEKTTASPKSEEKQSDKQ